MKSDGMFTRADSILQSTMRVPIDPLTFEKHREDRKI